MKRRSFLFSALSLLAAPFLPAQDKQDLTQKLNTADLKEAVKAEPKGATEKKIASQGGPRASIYPFDVRVGGQLAVVEGNRETALFAKIPQPVPADAAIEVDGPAGMLIVNVFPVRANGTVPQGAPVKALFLQSGTRLRLNETMDKSVLEPGLWGANVVFANTTSRVMFEVR